jgi:hypothetical protein
MNKNPSQWKNQGEKDGGVREGRERAMGHEQRPNNSRGGKGTQAGNHCVKRQPVKNILQTLARHSGTHL